MSGPTKIKLVKHIYPGYRPLFEIQAFSNDKNKWYAMHTSNDKASIDNFINKYYTGLEIPEIDCIHAREN